MSHAIYLSGRVWTPDQPSKGKLVLARPPAPSSKRTPTSDQWPRDTLCRALSVFLACAGLHRDRCDSRASQGSTTKVLWLSSLPPFFLFLTLALAFCSPLSFSPVTLTSLPSSHLLPFLHPPLSHLPAVSTSEPRAETGKRGCWPLLPLRRVDPWEVRSMAWPS